MPRREILNETYLCKRVKETGGSTRKVRWVGHRGAPDRLVGWPQHGVAVFVELKEEDQPWGLQDHQRRELAWMYNCGLRAAILASKAEIDQFIAFHTEGKEQ